MRVVLASRNLGKLKEFQALLADAGLELASLADWPQVGQIEETGRTFTENARLKAHAVAQATGLPALADDSGLSVAALGDRAAIPERGQGRGHGPATATPTPGKGALPLDGRPGVHSARYAGPGATDRENYEKLLAELTDVPPENRQAAFVCCLCLAWPDGREILAEGRCEGLIAAGPKGTNGFGYDPVFLVPAYNKTMAELAPEVKKDRKSVV
jgi:XTP/dITP diphosphohydrolase